MNFISRILRKIKRSLQPTPLNYVIQDASWVATLKCSLAHQEHSYIALCHRDWKGVSSATLELFNNVVYVGEVYDTLTINKVVDIISESNIAQVILSGFPLGWDRIIRLVKAKKSSITFKVVWHGSIAQHYEDYSTSVFLEALQLSKTKAIASIGFVKKSTYEIYYELGYPCHFIRNRVLLNPLIKIKERSLINFENIKIGVFSVDVTLRKNTYTNIAAACYIKKAQLTICPSNSHLEKVIKHFNLDYHLVGQGLPRDELFRLIQQQDIIFYVTFSECAPMIPLEAMSLGVLCLMGSNNHYYEDYPILNKFLVVHEADNPKLIAQMALQALQNRNLIMCEYAKFAEANAKLSIESVQNFLAI